jgi:hypothetical protein
LAEDDYYDIIPPLVVETSAEETELSIPDNFSSNIDHNIIGDKSFDDEDNQLPKQILRRSTRLQSNSGNKGGKLLSAVVENPLIKPRIPRNVAEARFDNLNSEAWIEAMHQEVSSLFDQNTFEFIAFIPPNHQTVPSMFVFDVRYNSDGTIKKFKCRLVARGDQQDSSTFGDTYADTIASRSINILLSLAALYDLDLQSIDIKTAFLYSPVAEDIYLRRPHGVGDEILPKYVKLNKCLYGLKQAAHE